MTHNQHYKFYIASCHESGGIVLCEFKNGKAQIIEKVILDKPMYMTLHKNKMYILLRAPFEDNNYSGLISFDNQYYLTNKAVSLPNDLCLS